MATRRTRSPSKVFAGLGALGAVTAVGLAGTASPAAADPVPDHSAVPRGPVSGHAPTRTDADERSHVVRSGDTVSALAARYDTTVAAIVKANDLDSRALIRIGQVLVIPGGTGAGSAPTHAQPSQRDDADTVRYTVRRGDTLSHIAARYDTTVAAITRLNHLSSTVIYPGQVLEVAGSAESTGDSSSSGSSSSSSSSTSSGGRYTVRSGDTVSAIAARYDTTVAAIVKANDLDSRALIRIGQVLVIPGASGSSSSGSSSSGSSSSSTSSGSTSSAGRYTVRSGDTLSGIAARHDTTVSALMKANKLSSTVIHPGQTLRLPGSSSSSSSSSGSGSSSSSSSSSSTGSYKVRSGDTLSRIASQHGTTVAAIVDLNDLDSTVIYPNQVLRVPEQLVPGSFLGYTYPASVVAAANENKRTLLSMDLPSREEMQSIVRTTAVEMGVDPALAMAVAHQESGFNPTAVSPANAVGVMQVIPSSGEWASDMVGEDLDLLDPHDNVVAGVAILRYLVKTAPDLQTAIGGYYQGLGSVTRNGLYDDTRRYVANVQTLMTRYD